MTYTVLVDDNFHYMDESHRYAHGEYETKDEAIAAAKSIVDAFLADAYEPGMPTDKLIATYVLFGDDPFISCDEPGVLFSARTYARERCAEICEGRGKE